MSCSQTSLESTDLAKKERVKQTDFQLSDFLEENVDLDEKVDLQFKKMSDSALVAQLIMPATGRLGLPKEDIEKYTKKGIIGGVLMLNGTVDEFTTWIKEFEEINKKKGYLPFLYSADAEPSLINRKIIGSTPVKKAQEVKTIEEAIEVASLISKDLNEIGINYNFAPVIDVSGNTTVGYRGFGEKKENLIPWSTAFVKETQSKNIIATAKHFPGHGLVSGDTHKTLQTINGELKELENYPPLIQSGVLSIMIAHIAITNNKDYDSKGMPATTSDTIVTKLLRNKLNFKGLIVTDAMNMGGVSQIKNAAVKTIDAGCDIILMPLEIKIAYNEILNKYKANEVFKLKVDNSAKRIVRMKICLGLIK
jgi:beta-N-acetylhexosaminidase